MKKNQVIINLINKNKDGSIEYLAGNVHPQTHKYEERGPTQIIQGKKVRGYKKGTWDSLKYEIYINEDRQILKSNKIYELIIDYPVQTPMISKIKGPKTLRQVLDFAVKQYRKMYKEENKSPGKYGIYGHDLCDLSIDSIIVQGSKVHLVVSS